MIKKWNDFVKENVVNPDSYIDIKMQELRDLILSISNNFKFSWENLNDSILKVILIANNMNVEYVFDISNMSLIKTANNVKDFDNSVSSIDDGISQIQSDIYSLIGVSENISINDIDVLDSFIDGENGQIEVSINGEDISFIVLSNGQIFFATDDDANIAEELGLEIDDELQKFIKNEYDNSIKSNRMNRLGFFKGKS